MRTNTAKYEASHGKAPKGWGGWWLEVTGTDGTGRYTTEVYKETGTLSEAKKQAVARMKAEVGGVEKVVEVTVLP